MSSSAPLSRTRSRSPIPQSCLVILAAFHNGDNYLFHVHGRIRLTFTASGSDITTQRYEIFSVVVRNKKSRHSIHLPSSVYARLMACVLCLSLFA